VSARAKLAVLLWPLLVAAIAFGQADELAQARSERDQGHAALAIGHYQKVLQADPQNREALGELADVLDSQGRWSDAIPLLEKLTTLEPGNAARLNQLGRYVSWHAGGAAAALPPLQRAGELAPANLQYRFDYADVLSRSGEHTDEARNLLRSILEQDPRFMPALVRLAAILSWNNSTRQEATTLFDRGLAADANNSELLNSYAEMLSWRHESRAQAESLFNRELALHPDDVRALLGKAQVLAWSGRSQEALALYDGVLRSDPSNAAALRGKAEILNWRGSHAEARALLMQARSVAPQDPAVALELARAEAGLGRYSIARALLQQTPGATAESGDIRQAVDRALGTWVEAGYQGRFNEHTLNYNRAILLLSTPLGVSNRVTFGYEPTRWSNPGGDFSSNYFLAAIDSTPSESVSTHAQVGAETFAGSPAAIDAAFTINYRLRPAWTLEGGFERAAVQENLLSEHGLTIAGETFGQVRSNLGSVGFRYVDRRHHWDTSLHYTDGAYTGRSLDANRRWGADFDIGTMVRSEKPYVRLGYGVSYMSFDHDANFQLGAAPPQISGGYFSPTRFLLNYASLTAAHRFGTRMEWQASGTVGMQNVEDTFNQFSDPKFAATAVTSVVVRVTAHNELRAGYDFLNVYNAFRRSIVRVSWRFYF
jgi:tetratricopeptide (TPR) repeat protein